MHFRNALWIAGQVARMGAPRRVVLGPSGVGDELMAAAAVRQVLRQPDRSQWFAAHYPDLHRAADLPLRIVSYDARYFRLAERLGRPIADLSYRDDATGGDMHHIEAMARQLGGSGRIELRTELRLTAAERAKGRLAPDQIVVQSATLGGSPLSTKQWPPELMQRTVAGLAGRGRFQIVQIGNPREPPLEGVLDLRGKTTLREAAALLAGSRLYLGPLGGMMHLARAVDCPAVIVCGGREPAGRAGYRANVNLERRPPCSPCYLRDGCPYGLNCLTDIQPAEVIAAAERQLAVDRSTLPVDTVDLGPG